MAKYYSCWFSISLFCFILFYDNSARVFVWGRRPDVSSCRFPFHVRYFDFNIWGNFYYFIIAICCYLSISWIYRLEHNRVLQLNASKVPHYFFFFAYRVECLIGFPFHFNERITKFLLGQVEREIPGKTNYTCWSNICCRNEENKRR